MAMEESENLVYAVFTPLLISGTGIVITAVAILIYHFIIIKFCHNRERQRRRLIFDQKQANQGLDKKILNKIPTLHYSSGKNNGQFLRVDQTECAICLGEFEEKVVVRVLPKCRHAFHLQCVDEWLSFHTNCPVCRSTICPIVISELPLSVESDHHHGDHRIRIDDEELCRFDREKPSRVVLGLKRSSSMDQSQVLVDILQRKVVDHKKASSSFSSSIECLTQSKSMMSFSQLQIGRTNTSSNMASRSDPIHPC